MPASKKAASSSTSQHHAILGTDEGRVKEVALRLVQQLAPASAGDFGVEIIEGQADNAEHAGRICGDVCMALQTLPFFGGGKVVWLKGANFLGDTQTGRAQDAVEGFERILDVLESGLPPDIRLVLSATAIDKRRTAYKRLSKLATIDVHDKPDTSKTGWEAAVLSQIQGRVRELGLVFESGALELLVQLCGDDTRQLANELEKIDLYLGERRRCGLATVRGLVSMSRAGVLWEIGNAIGARDLPRALDLLSTLLYQGESAIGLLLAAIVPKVRNLLIVKDLISKNQVNTTNYDAFSRSLEALPSHLTAHLPRKKDGTGFNIYPLFLSVAEARKFTLDELHDGLTACLEANEKLVTTQLDEKVVLERLLVGLLAPRPVRQKPNPRRAAA
jgi:DNA polymerase-3 subunit delta